jgi:hypothetical protein
MPKVCDWGSSTYPVVRALLVGAGLRKLIMPNGAGYPKVTDNRRIQRVLILGPISSGATIRAWAETVSDRIDAQTRLTDVMVTYQPGMKEIIIDQLYKPDDIHLSRVVILQEISSAPLFF